MKVKKSKMTKKTYKPAHYDDCRYFSTGAGKNYGAKGLLGTITGKYALKVATLLGRVPDFRNFRNHPTFNNMTAEEIAKIKSICTKIITKGRDDYLVITRYELEPGSSLWVSHV